MIRDSPLYLNAIRSPTQDPERLPEINWDRKDVLALWWDFKLGGVARAISISVLCAGKRTKHNKANEHHACILAKSRLGIGPKLRPLSGA